MIDVYGQAFKAEVTSFDIEFDDVGMPALAVGLRLKEQAVDPSEIKKDAQWTTISSDEVEHTARIAFTEKWVEQMRDENKGPLSTALKALGLGHLDPADVLEPPEGVEVKSPVGRWVIVQCSELPDDFVQGSELPPERWWFKWAISRGNFSKATPSDRANAAKRFRKPVKVDPQPKHEDVPF